MSELPLNSVENTRDNFIEEFDNNVTSKSPVKLSMTERNVIGGLKQLTELLFKQHYKQNQNDENDVTQSEEFLQSDEVTTSTESEPNSSDMQSDKENSGNFQRFLDNAMGNGHAESFCAMVVRQLTSADSIQHSEEWHRGQLDAYNMARQHFFERIE
ncbi:uncharacterized protein LOC116342983 [Contarinia nasturtii]|uniref:uncharacterized protein LOC116342983 n=1 Tax=Contarinia nasturtii TaxID=265458 RepID=UPI0012D4BA78|nr:uncharacterized protein LOC116342983 [Contarinia nasturtii]